MEKEIKDFFKIDIENIPEDMLKFIDAGESPTETMKEYYDVQLKEKELGTFTKLEIEKYESYKSGIKIDDNIKIDMITKVDLKFTGYSDVIRVGLSDFVDFCYNTYGLDCDGKGRMRNVDLQDMKGSKFTRNWKDVDTRNVDLQDMKGSKITRRWKDIDIINGENEIKMTLVYIEIKIK